MVRPYAKPLLSRSTLSPDSNKKELAILDVVGFPIMRAWYLVRARGKRMSPVATTFNDYMRSHIDLFTPR